MSDFFQNGIITTLHNFETDSLDALEARLSHFLRRSDIALILPIIPRDLLSDSSHDIVRELADAPYISEVILVFWLLIRQ